MDFIDISSTILTICVILIASSKRSEKDLKLSLNPVELLDLIIEEQMKQNTAPAKHHKCKLKFDKHLLDTEEMEITTTIKESDNSKNIGQSIIKDEKTLPTNGTETGVIDANILNSLWSNRLPFQQQQYVHDFSANHVKIPPRLTRLTKALLGDFDPFFQKSYFEPFENRPKPVTLVAFRKNGLLSRRSIKVVDSKSSEVAELQSPYNDVSSFWLDEPGQS
ncbi:uncharacterized protein LOC113517855 [Galleria mellonella]|uniref:Uncharacterized protein LOC113517855 n=1 Tax=Galleria mellonella TaxID=7137 RepID=A0ABM3MMF8_GALME|nr:uncharacterized protein LOC113517855 [Galleria mellonella]